MVTFLKTDFSRSLKILWKIRNSAELYIRGFYSCAKKTQTPPTPSGCKSARYHLTSPRAQLIILNAEHGSPVRSATQGRHHPTPAMALSPTATLFGPSVEFTSRQRIYLIFCHLIGHTPQLMGRTTSPPDFVRTHRPHTFRNRIYSTFGSNTYCSSCCSYSRYY